MTEICQRLDGIALAIELAAARMVSMSAQEVLRPPRRSLPTPLRHRTGPAAPSDPARGGVVVLRPARRPTSGTCSTGAAVFAGGFGVAAAVHICADPRMDRLAVLDLLDSLVRKSLITAEPVSGQTRYGLLETIRHFGEDQLDRQGITDEVRHLHASYFAAEATAAWEQVERARAARRPRLGGPGVRRPAGRLPMGHRPRRPVGGGVDRGPHHARRHGAPALRARRLGGRAPARGRRGRPHRPPPRVPRRQRVRAHGAARRSRRLRPGGGGSRSGSPVRLLRGGLEPGVGGHRASVRSGVSTGGWRSATSSWPRRGWPTSSVSSSRPRCCRGSGDRTRPARWPTTRWPPPAPGRTRSGSRSRWRPTRGPTPTRTRAWPWTPWTRSSTTRESTVSRSSRPTPCGRSPPSKRSSATPGKPSSCSTQPWRPTTGPATTAAWPPPSPRWRCCSARSTGPRSPRRSTAPAPATASA